MREIRLQESSLATLSCGKGRRSRGPQARNGRKPQLGFAFSVGSRGRAQGERGFEGPRCALDPHFSRSMALGHAHDPPLTSAITAPHPLSFTLFQSRLILALSKRLPHPSPPSPVCRPSTARQTPQPPPVRLRKSHLPPSRPPARVLLRRRYPHRRLILRQLGCTHQKMLTLSPRLPRMCRTGPARGARRLPCILSGQHGWRGGMGVGRGEGERWGEGREKNEWIYATDRQRACNIMNTRCAWGLSDS